MFDQSLGSLSFEIRGRTDKLRQDVEGAKRDLDRFFSAANRNKVNFTLAYNQTQVQQFKRELDQLAVPRVIKITVDLSSASQQIANLKRELQSLQGGGSNRMGSTYSPSQAPRIMGGSSMPYMPSSPIVGALAGAYASQRGGGMSALTAGTAAYLALPPARGANVGNSPSTPQISSSGSSASSMAYAVGGRSYAQLSDQSHLVEQATGHVPASAGVQRVTATRVGDNTARLTAAVSSASTAIERLGSSAASASSRMGGGGSAGASGQPAMLHIPNRAGAAAGDTVDGFGGGGSGGNGNDNVGFDGSGGGNGGNGGNGGAGGGGASPWRRQMRALGLGKLTRFGGLGALGLSAAAAYGAIKIGQHFDGEQGADNQFEMATRYGDVSSRAAAHTERLKYQQEHDWSNPLAGAMGMMGMSNLYDKHFNGGAYQAAYKKDQDTQEGHQYNQGVFAQQAVVDQRGFAIQGSALSTQSANTDLILAKAGIQSKQETVAANAGRSAGLHANEQYYREQKKHIREDDKDGLKSLDENRAAMDRQVNVEADSRIQTAQAQLKSAGRENLAQQSGMIHQNAGLSAAFGGKSGNVYDSFAGQEAQRRESQKFELEEAKRKYGGTGIPDLIQRRQALEEKTILAERKRGVDIMQTGYGIESEALGSEASGNHTRANRVRFSGQFDMALAQETDPMKRKAIQQAQSAMMTDFDRKTSYDRNITSTGLKSSLNQQNLLNSNQAFQAQGLGIYDSALAQSKKFGDDKDSTNQKLSLALGVAQIEGVQKQIKHQFSAHGAEVFHGSYQSSARSTMNDEEDINVTKAALAKQKADLQKQQQGINAPNALNGVMNTGNGAGVNGGNITGADAPMLTKTDRVITVLEKIDSNTQGMSVFG